MHEALAEKVVSVLEACKVEVAKKFFNTLDEAGGIGRTSAKKMPSPSKGHMPHKAGSAKDPNSKEFDKSGHNLK